MGRKIERVSKREWRNEKRGESGIGERGKEKRWKRRRGKGGRGERDESGIRGIRGEWNGEGKDEKREGVMMGGERIE